jgi:hypothetical protein
MDRRRHRIAGLVLAGAAALAGACARRGSTPVGTPARAVVPPIPPDSMPGWLFDDTNAVAGPYRISKNVLEVAFVRGTPRAARQAAVDLVGGEVVGGARLFSDGEGVYLVRVPSDSAATGVYTAVARLDSLPQVDFAARHQLKEAESRRAARP